MSSTICEFCEKQFASKAAKDYHVDKKVCQKPQPNKTCPYCHKVFKSKQSCENHVKNKICDESKKLPEEKEKIKLSLKKTTEDHRLLYDEMSREQLIDSLANMERENKILKEKPQNVTIDQRNVNIDQRSVNINMNQNIIFPSEFGKENMENIKNKLGDIFLGLIKKDLFQSIQGLIEKIHNSVELPEYHNVCIKNERNAYASVSNGKEFKRKPKKTIIDQIIEDKRSLLNSYVDENGDKLGKKILDKYERYQDLLDSNDEFKKSLELEIGGILLDMKTVIANDDKIRKSQVKENITDFNLLPEKSEETSTPDSDCDELE